MAAQLVAHLGAAQGAQKPWKILSILAIPGLRPRACGTARAPRRSVTQENICAVNRVTSQSARRPPITLQGALEILTAQTRGAATPLNLGAAQGAQKPWKILSILAIPGLRLRDGYRGASRRLVIRFLLPWIRNGILRSTTGR